MSFQTQSKIPFIQNEPLENHTTFRIGGCAALFALPENEEQLIEIIDVAEKEKLPWFVLGSGSNVLFDDRGYNGIIIAMQNFKREAITCRDHILLVSAGTTLPRLLRFTRENNIGGLEFLHCIPGTVGGAIKRNTSFKREEEQNMNSMANIIEDIQFYSFEKKTIICIERGKLCFKYRECLLPPGVILSASLKIYAKDKKYIEEEMDKNYNYRKQKHDIRFPSAGCVFKNPTSGSATAGQLIERCGLKGMSVGGARISEKHGNYIINLGDATSADVIALIRVIKEKVKQIASVDLENEIEYIQ